MNRPITSVSIRTMRALLVTFVLIGTLAAPAGAADSQSPDIGDPTTGIQESIADNQDRIDALLEVQRAQVDGVMDDLNETRAGIQARSEALTNGTAQADAARSAAADRQERITAVNQRIDEIRSDRQQEICRDHRSDVEAALDAYVDRESRRILAIGLVLESVTEYAENSGRSIADSDLLVAATSAESAATDAATIAVDIVNISCTGGDLRGQMETVTEVIESLRLAAATFAAATRNVVQEVHPDMTPDTALPTTDTNESMGDQ